MCFKRLFFICFGIASVICFSTEAYEIGTKSDVWWSDHLHNMLDHVMFLIVNYIGMKTLKERE